MNRAQRDDPLARLRPDRGPRAAPPSNDPEATAHGDPVLHARGRHRTGAAPTFSHVVLPTPDVRAGQPDHRPTLPGSASRPAVRRIVGPAAVTLASAMVAGGLMWWLLSDDDPGFVLSAAATSPPTSTLPLTPGDMPPTLAPDPLPASVPAASSGHTPGSSVTVHVAGAVATPGVVVVHGGSRVIEAVAAAGGLTGAADADSVNLARQVLDGELVVVPTPGQVLSAPVAPGAAGGGGIAGDGGGDAAGGATGLVDINRADASRLDGLPGIGPVLAERIISYREDTGPFAHIEDLRSVPGIGDKVFGGIRDLVVV